MTDAPKRSTHVWAENDFAFLGGPREIHLRAEDYDEGVSIRHAMTADEAQAFGEHLIELASTFRELAAPDPEKDEQDARSDWLCPYCGVECILDKSGSPDPTMPPEMPGAVAGITGLQPLAEKAIYAAIREALMKG